MKRILAFTVLMILGIGAAFAEGVTDFVIDPSAGRTINVSGSYRLAGSVKITANVVALTITTSDVQIDLNGHAINCMSGGTSQGIEAFNNTRITLRNGTLNDAGGHGIRAPGESVTLEGVTVEGCGLMGIITGPQAHFRNTRSRHNGQGGIVAGVDSVLEGCIVQGNNKAGSFDGIFAGGGSVVRGCTANANTSVVAGSNSTGIRVGPSSVVESCSAAYNFSQGLSYGIRADIKCVLTGNACNVNGFGFGTSYGILAGEGSVIKNNTCNGNEGNDFAFGIQAGAACRIEGNICDGNLAYSAFGTAVGISAGASATVVGNTATRNTCTNWVGQGIVISTKSRAESNLCTENHGFLASYGIFVAAFHNVIRANMTSGNSQAGIRLDTGSNVCQENFIQDGLNDFGGNSIGAGDLANHF